LHDGEIVYKDKHIMVVYYKAEKEYLETYDIARYMNTKDGYAVQLRYARELGKFKKGDMLFEYDSFRGEIPSFGYNLNTAFFPFFSFTCEDAIVISESAANRCQHQKIETVWIPIYPYSSFKNIYPLSKYGFIPEVGQTIDGKIIFSQTFDKTIKPEQVNKTIGFYNYNEFEANDMLFNSYNILTKNEDAKVYEIRVHRVRKPSEFNISNNVTREIVARMAEDHVYDSTSTYQELTRLFGKDYTEELLIKHYFWHDLKHLKNDIDFKNVQCMIEIRLVSDHRAEIGDKFANRYANKGTVSLIIPDELRPYSLATGEPIDLIVNPLSVFNRMVYGQLIEGAVAKAVKKVEAECIADIKKVPGYLRKFSKMSSIFGSKEYSEKLKELAISIETDSDLELEFQKDLQNGLYLEAPSFVAIDAVELIGFIENEFEIKINDDVVIPTETFEYMKRIIGNEVIIPEEDVIMEKVFNVTMYMLKLKHLSQGKMSARDFGKYKKGSNSPVKSSASGFDKASKLGEMEMDAFIAHNCVKAMREFRTVKSDVPSMKQDLVEQILNTGMYDMPDDSVDEGVKVIIKNMIKMINN